ncbi:hypothetical protein CERSUDRAFT_115890 [Gelatoporia subvermispora B]|uniref:C2H2-type domain-containing protein n=1 Tax=Ceriporiopsis subvermispora (strain B) TaxID=914234 RepID=M2RC46_CERS8|nr:hypothetical protein CERSUDRAFT_115890 [Gelatoporia subvermispora B]
MATAQPIALPSTSESNDFAMGSGSFTGQNGSFNPASYTRRFIGSPLSFRAGSFGTRFYPSMSPGQFLGPFDTDNFKLGKLSSSVESDRGSIMNALSVLDRQDELCRDYTCCGQNLTDLHALVDHFEECHVVVVDPYAPQVPVPQSAPATTSQASSYFPDPSAHVAPTYQGSFDPDDMDLDVDRTSAPSSCAPSPPDTPVSTPLSSYGFMYPNSAPASTCSSPGPTPISAFETTTVLPSRSGHSALSVGFPTASRASHGNISTRAEEAFNAYAGYSDYSALMPGTVPSTPVSSAPSPEEGGSIDPSSTYTHRSACVPPALLLNSNATTPDSTPSSSRVASPAPGQTVFRNVAAAGSSSQASSSASSNAASQTPRASTTLSRPASSLLLSKPFKCPKPNCNKSYKQANGLKYHMTHGSCNFAPPKDLEQLQQILASKRNGKDVDEPISDAELREVEKEAERRLRPYACGVGDCQRRYKNMNGLRYHYQHSGDHGAIGLALLASGQHECLQHTKSHQNSRHNTPAHPAQTNAPATSSPLAGTQGRVYAPTPVAPAPALPSYQAAAMVPPPYQHTMQQQQQSQQMQQQYAAQMQMPPYMMPMTQ